MALDPKYLSASDGTGSAVLAHITAPRIVGSTTLKVDNVNDWPAFFIATTGQLNANNYIIESTKKEFRGHLQGTDIIIDGFEAGFTDTGNTAQEVAIIKQTSGWANGVADNVAQQNSAISAFTASNGDWRLVTNSSNAALTGVTASYLGQRSYQVTLPGVDATGYAQPGHRFRSSRTVAAPTQSTLLNGTNQYWNNTSPTKFTFTNNFVVSTWVKLSSYPSSAGSIISRYNGTSGFDLTVTSTGQIQLAFFNGGAANYNFTQSYQSIPLNKWTHLAIQKDGSSNTISPTISYVMIDGVDVPAFPSTAGTNPTSLVQAGNLEIGSRNGGLNPFPGKIAQAAVFNAKVTQATMRGYMSQGLLGTETSLLAAWSFNGNANDLVTTSPANLSPNNGAVATNADSPFGGMGNGTISPTYDYGIIQSVTKSGSDTTLVVQTAEGCAIPTSGGMSAVHYSVIKSAIGFPGEEGKWFIESLYKVSKTGSYGSLNTWNDTGARLTVPTGKWIIGYQGLLGMAATASGTQSSFNVLADFTPVNNSYSYELITRLYQENAINVLRDSFKQVPKNVSSQTPFILWAAADAGQGTITWAVRGDQGTVNIFSKNAYA